MRLRKKDENNPYADARRVWVVLLFSLSALMAASAFPLSPEAVRVYAPIHPSTDGVVVWEDGAPLIDINRADEGMLMELPGIGEKRAAAILRYREQNGPFASVEELLNVPEIPEKVFLEIQVLLRAD